MNKAIKIFLCAYTALFIIAMGIAYFIDKKGRTDVWEAQMIVYKTLGKLESMQIDSVLAQKANQTNQSTPPYKNQDTLFFAPPPLGILISMI